jgi:hypothetical protein
VKLPQIKPAANDFTKLAAQLHGDHLLTLHLNTRAFSTCGQHYFPHRELISAAENDAALTQPTLLIPVFKHVNASAKCEQYEGDNVNVDITP